MPPENSLSDLNRAQRSAVTATGNTLVVACPGSGKTRLLESRADYLLGRNARARIVAVTFTRQSAKELKARIHRRVGTRIEQVRIGTFHSLARMQLHHANRLPQLINGAEQISLIARAYQLEGDGLSYDEAVNAVERHKAVLDPHLGDTPADRVCRAYDQLLRRNNAIDFADLLIHSVRAMREKQIHPIHCDYMLVDEGQDTDAIQFAWVAAHAAHGVIVTLVGDDDQCIYGWRHALGYTGMRRFETEHRADRITLEINYRSHAEILRHAHALISNNRERLTKTPTPEQGAGGMVKALRFNTRDDEVYAIADLLQAAPGEWALLARTNNLLNKIEGALTAFRIPYVKREAKSLWALQPVALLTSLLRTVVSPDSSMAIDQLLRWTGIPEETISELHRASGSRTLYAYLAGGVDWTAMDITRTERKTLQRLVERMPEWRQLVNDKRHDLLVSSVHQWMRRETNKDREIELIDIAATTLGRLRGSVLERLTFLVRSNDKPGDSSAPAWQVDLLTLHSAKGLEFPRVWMFAVEESILPHADSLDIEEERRLCYVGMTRAQKQLIVSSAGPLNPPSRFQVESGIAIEHLDQEQCA